MPSCHVGVIHLAVVGLSESAKQALARYCKVSFPCVKVVAPASGVTVMVWTIACFVSRFKPVH